MNFQDAINAQSSGDIKKAEKIYKRLLSKDPNNFQILHNYAVINFNLKKFNEAENLFKKAILINKNNHQIFNSYGVLLKEIKQYNEAIAKFNTSIELRDDYLSPYLNLISIYKEYNNQQELLNIYNKIITIKPDFIEMYFEISSIFEDQGKLEDAIKTLKTIFRYAPESINCHLKISDLHKKNNQPEESKKIIKKIIDIFKNKIKLEKNNGDFYNNIGFILINQNQIKEAIEYLKQGININPNLSNLYYNLSRCQIQVEISEFENAKINYEKAISLEPLNIQYNIDYAHLIIKEFYEFEKGIEIIKKFEELNPNNREITWYKSNILLEHGNFIDGWNAYNKCIMDKKNQFKLTKLNLWNKEILDGNLLVWSGQGVGDFIFFSKMLKLLIPYAKKIFFICDPRLISIYKRYFSKINNNNFEIKAEYKQKKISKHIAVEMLGTFFANNKREIDKFSKEELIASNEWNLEIDNFLKGLPKDRLNIGLSWKTANFSERHRTIELEKFKTLFLRRDINFINLQFGDVTDEVTKFEKKYNLKFHHINSINNSKDLDKLLSLINKLDLILTIQNTTAHLSLSLQKKTFVLLNYKPRYYWYGDNPKQCYWYPSAVLFRQKNHKEDWAHVLRLVEEDINLIKKNEIYE
jgi:tetratricopeptide (TPR) repeat protein